VTDPQAQQLWALLLAAYPHQPLEAPTQVLYLAHLKALAWRDGRTETALRGLLLTHDGAFLPPIKAVVAAAGVAPEAAHLLVEAMTTGQELVPDLGSRTGWAVGAAAVPLPPAPIDAPALPDGAGFTEAERRQNLQRLGSLARQLAQRGKAS
jgi:hypothetical protein